MLVLLVILFLPVIHAFGQDAGEGAPEAAPQAESWVEDKLAQYRFRLPDGKWTVVRHLLII